MNLLEEALKARENSYSPYSKFLVGAALLTKDGKIYYGANIENVSFGLSMCAERVVIFKAISDGVKKEDIMELAVIGNTDKPISPCGACRQVMIELLDKKTKIILGNIKGQAKEFTLEELMPYSFEELK